MDMKEKPTFKNVEPVPWAPVGSTEQTVSYVSDYEGRSYDDTDSEVPEGQLSSDGEPSLAMHNGGLHDEEDHWNPDEATGIVERGPDELQDNGLAIADEYGQPASDDGDLDALTEQWLAASDAARGEIEALFAVAEQQRRDKELE